MFSKRVDNKEKSLFLKLIDVLFFIFIIFIIIPVFISSHLTHPTAHIILKSILSPFLALLLFRYPCIMCNMWIYLTIRFVCKCFFNVSIIKNLYLIYPFLLYVRSFPRSEGADKAGFGEERMRMDGWLTEWYEYPFKIIQNSARKRSMRDVGAFLLL